MKYSVVTFGCRVNQADSLGFEEDLLARGGVSSPPEQADLIVVNTCSVTATADQGARQVIRRIARDKLNQERDQRNDGPNDEQKDCETPQRRKNFMPES